MRWRRAVGAAVGAAGLAAAVLGIVYRDEIRVALALRRCEAAWERVDDYWSDFGVEVELGPLSTAIEGAVGYRRPDQYVLELRRGRRTYCRVIRKTPAEAFVAFPGAGVGVEVEFAPTDDAPVSSLSPAPWLDQLGEGSEFRWIGKQAVEGRPCSVLELAPSEQQTHDGSLMVAPALGRSFADVPFLGSWKRTRVYLDEETGLPIRGEALKESGAVLFSWTARNVRINEGLAQESLEPNAEGLSVVKRRYDPKHPERLFLPPDGGRSLLRRLGEHVLDELTR